MKTDGKGRPQDPGAMIGGYATGSLSAREQETLLEAALGDQALFDELIKEQALKEMLEEPGAKRELIGALGKTNPGFWARLTGWMGPSLAWSAVGGAAAALVLGVALLRQPKPPVTVARAPVTEPESPTPVEENPGAPAELAESRSLPPPSSPLPEAHEPEPKRETVASAEMQERSPAPAAAAGQAARDSAPPAPAAGRAQPEFAAAPTPASEMKRVVSSGPALEYGILRGDVDGVFRPVASPGELADGDRFKLTITPHQPGFLEVLRRAASGVESPIYSANVIAGATLIVPAGGSLRREDVAAIVVELGQDPSEREGPPGLGIGGLSARKNAGSPMVRKQTGPPATPVRIEIKIRP